MSDGFQPASIDADGARRSAMPIPRLDPESALVFVINASAGAHDVDAKRAVIESTLAAQGRRGELLVCGPDDLARVATAAAAAALARGTAVVAVGGDGSLGTVAQA
uniref:diacylglycerol kinase family protein n=1 Tax=Thauera aminoaromatica TaxID=164330 RepID=UPI0035AEE11A